MRNRINEKPRVKVKLECKMKDYTGLKHKRHMILKRGQKRKELLSVTIRSSPEKSKISITRQIRFHYKSTNKFSNVLKSILQNNSTKYQ